MDMATGSHWPLLAIVTSNSTISTTITFTPPSILVQDDANDVINYAPANSQIKVSRGLDDLTPSCTFAIADLKYCMATVSATGLVHVTQMTSSTAAISVKVTLDGKDYLKTIYVYYGGGQAISGVIGVTPAPFNLRVTTGFTFYYAEVDPVGFTVNHGYKSTRIYAALKTSASIPTVSQAKIAIDSFGFGHFIDAEPGDIWYVWASFVANNGVESAKTGPIIAQIGLNTTAIFNKMESQIYATELQKAVEANLDTLDQQVAGLAGSDQAINQQIYALQQKDASIDSQIIVLSNTDASFATEITNLKAKDVTVTQQITALQTVDTQHASAITALQTADTGITARLDASETADGTMQTNWSIKSQIATGGAGAPYITGVGLFSQNGAAGPTSSFNVMVDAFVVGAPNYGATPFQVRTAPFVVDGYVYPAGVYALNFIAKDAQITNAKIANLAVDTAKIKDLAVSTAKIVDLAVNNAKIDNLAVTTGKIDDLAVTTLKVAGKAVTVGVVFEVTSLPGGGYTSPSVALGTTTIPSCVTVTVLARMSVTVPRTVTVKVYRDGVQVALISIPYTGTTASINPSLNIVVPDILPDNYYAVPSYSVEIQTTNVFDFKMTLTALLR
jgi:hypothetical protein